MAKKDKRPPRERLLDRWQAKARCSRTQYAAHMWWEQLRPHLSSYEAGVLRTAWSHVDPDFPNRDPSELNSALLTIRRAWENGRVIHSLTDFLADYVDAPAQKKKEKLWPMA